MTASSDTKTCGICCMEIPARARKCPYCRHLQNRLTVIMFHPVMLSVAGMILLVGLAAPFAMLVHMFDEGEDFRNHADEITIVSSDMTLANEDSPTVAIVGRIRNDSDFDWKQITFHAEFRDADGKLVDVGQRFDWAYYLPAHEEAAFKVSFRREFPEASYASHSVRVITARDGSARF